MKRREWLRAAGATTAFSVLPRGVDAAWGRLLAGYRPVAGLTEARRALVATIADVIIPRSDTPGASDVGVTDWVDLVVTEYYDDATRAEFVSGLDAIDRQARATKGSGVPALDAPARVGIVAALDAAPPAAGRDGAPAEDEATRAARAAYRRLKALVVHGYFTSRKVEREVLRVRMAFPTFEGGADVAPGVRP